MDRLSARPRLAPAAFSDRRAAHPGRLPLAMLRALLCVCLLACVGAAAAGAAPALNWNQMSPIDLGKALSGVSCASNTLCVAVDGEDHALISTDPTAGADASWSRVEIHGATALSGISCASNTLCVAVEEEGVFVSGSGGSTWSGLLKIDGAAALTGVSCAPSSLCVAVDKSGNALVSTDPAVADTAAWSPPVEIDKGHTLDSVSCASAALCVAVDDAGRALASSAPASGAWRARAIDSNVTALELSSVSCAPAPADVCVAVDGADEVFASGNPTASGPTWSTTSLESPNSPTSISCSAAGLCVAVDGGGGAYIGDDPTAATPSWTFESIDPPIPLSGVSCESEGLCTAVGGGGHVLVTQVPAPAVVTGTSSAIAETSATLTGTVTPEDAMLTECEVEYGPSEAYGQSAPCATPLPTGGVPQGVSVPVSGLKANTTYHFRLVAASASGAESGLDATFKTTAPALVQPHPSISGLPARGQRLTCKSGVTASGVTLTYEWLRDTKAITGASGSTYLVSSSDVSHHLQCRVTATNAAGGLKATSAFVTVPAGGIGSIAETQVGTPHVSGSKVSVPLTCSAQAAGSCTIALRLTVVETLRGKRVIAVAASTHRTTVTVGATTVHLPAGQRRTATVTLNATGRRLLARVHRLTAKLVVSGTVVGAISAALRSATVTLGGAGKASSHGRR